jgi:hypothetical protein
MANETNSPYGLPPTTDVLEVALRWEFGNHSPSQEGIPHGGIGTKFFRNTP